MTHSEGQREPVERLAEEFLERHRRGEQPSVTEYAQRHPELADEIRDVFPALLVLEEVGPQQKEGVDVVNNGGAEGEPLKRLGDYRIVREVGRGGMGIVYEALHETLGRHVALKVLPFRPSLDPLCLSRFRREARAAARLHHTNIVPVFDVDTCQGIHDYAMQFIRGQGLDQVLRLLRQWRATPVRPLRQPNLTHCLADGLRTGQFAGMGAESDPLAAMPDRPANASNVA